MIDFKGSQFEREIILWGVRWYVAYPISYRQLEEMMGERGVTVDHSTLTRWVIKYAPEFEKAFRRRQRPVGRSWRLEETSVKLKGKWADWYRAEYRQLNKGEEAPPISIVDFVACFADRKKAEEVARRGITGYYWTLMEHYRMDDAANFATTGASYQHYAKAAEQITAIGHDAVLEEFISSNLWGTPDMILSTLRRRRELIGDFEVNGAFSY